MDGKGKRRAAKRSAGAATADPAGPRRRRLVRGFDKAGIDAMLVTTPANVRYLTGFTGEDSYLLVGRKLAILLTDSRFQEQARLECPALELYIRQGRMTDAVKAALHRRGVRRLGVESESITLGLHDKLSQLLGANKLRSTENLVGELRLTKDDSELVAIRKAIRVAQRAFLGLIARGRKALVGRTEAQLAGELEFRMRQEGASGASFPSIVASGAHAALPHYRPGGTAVKAGQAVLFDWGALVDGYCSDLTRVVFTGRIPPPIGQIYEVVLSAQKKGIAAVRAGRPANVVDAAAREVIAAAGYGQQFGHGLGHGIGLEIHEAPSLSPRAIGRLRRGQIVTVEPGIYLPGAGGVRIEDDVLVEVGRGVVLSSLPSDLQAMVLQ